MTAFIGTSVNKFGEVVETYAVSAWVEPPKERPQLAIREVKLEGVEALSELFLCDDAIAVAVEVSLSWACGGAKRVRTISTHGLRQKCL